MDNQTVSLTASNIRYLLAVEKLSEEGRVRCVDVARQLGVARPSALRALENLSAQGLFQKSPDGAWSLTGEGAALAARYREYYNTVGGLFTRLLPLVIGIKKAMYASVRRQKQTGKDGECI